MPQTTPMLGSVKQQGNSEAGNLVDCTSELSADDLRALFRRLDWRSLGQCSCICRAWNIWANEPHLWEHQIAQSYHRPTMLQHYSLLSQPQLMAASDGQANPAVYRSQAPAPAAANSTAGAGAPAAGKQLFIGALAHPAAPHQAMLARFHAAMAQIRGWRLLIRRTPPAAQQSANTVAAESHSLSHDAVQQHLSSSSQPQQQQDTKKSGKQSERLVGWPQLLRWGELRSGKVWAIGCVEQQQKEQSCWVRFNLPGELKVELGVSEAVAAGKLSATVQALGPSSVGWFDVMSSNPFKIEDNDVDILLESHKTGFYAWDHTGEDGDDVSGDAQPMPWDIGARGPAVAPKSQGATQSSYAAAAGEQQQQQQQEGGPLGYEQQIRQMCKLRMLVYIHYEQLLKMLPQQLLQVKPLPSIQQRQSSSIQVAARELVAHKDAALWLHLDVCQLHGGVRLGSCVAPLRVARIGGSGVQFEAQQERVFAALYDPQCRTDSNSSSRVRLVVQQPSSAAGDSARPATSSQLPAEAGCDFTIIGRYVVQGQQKTSREGLLLLSAADVMKELLSMDEVMVDFALFDGAGQLLMGRGGVEVWTKEQTSLHTPPGQPAAAGPIMHTRTVQMLHFLVDGVDSRLWDNGIMVDAAAAPDGVVVPLLNLKFTWPALQGLFGDAKLEQQPTIPWVGEQDYLDDSDVSEAANILLGALHQQV